MPTNDYLPYLQHHGILGMKWGVRRYQNENGSLTSAGQKRYSRVKNNESGKSKSTAKKVAIGAGIASAVLAGIAVGEVAIIRSAARSIGNSFINGAKKTMSDHNFWKSLKNTPVSKL